MLPRRPKLVLGVWASLTWGLGCASALCSVATCVSSPRAFQIDFWASGCPDSGKGVGVIKIRAGGAHFQPSYWPQGLRTQVLAVSLIPTWALGPAHLGQDMSDSVAPTGSQAALPAGLAGGVPFWEAREQSVGDPSLSLRNERGGFSGQGCTVYTSVGKTGSCPWVGHSLVEEG